MASHTASSQRPTSVEPAVQLSRSVRYLKGIGPRRAVLLARIGIHTVGDLLRFYPRAYEDRSHIIPIATVRVGMHATVRGTVMSVTLRPTRRVLLVEARIQDESGEIVATWFNQPYLENQLACGTQVILSGPVRFYKALRLQAPDYQVVAPGDKAVHVGRIVPIYTITEGIGERWLRKVMMALVEHHARAVPELLPQTLRAQNELLPIEDAVSQIHFPSSWDHERRARERLVFEEFFLFELSLVLQRRRSRLEERAPELSIQPSPRESFEKMLPFRLTASQTACLKDLEADLANPYPMQRLLQGDVGSGKTVVAAYAMFLAQKAGFQSALLCPTEVLAAQHAQTLETLFGSLRFRIALAVGGLARSVRHPMAEAVARGDIDIVVGTHALLEESWRFGRLGLVVIDEQHKFGVKQRALFLDVTPKPHVLMMSATPIPRTLGHALYAGLDVSTLSEMPAGRPGVKTFWITQKKEAEVFEFIRDRARRGQQAYLIYPLVDEGKSRLRAATREYEKFQTTIFRDLEVGLLHGRMERTLKEKTMQRFRSGEIQVLFSTSVVEVGLDNPNASSIVIEHAEQFGLAQLHQMRGRVGRGRHEAYCFLFGDPPTVEGKKRLRILTKTHDGFRIAEEDLKLRGPGDLLGLRQSGIPFFTLGDLARDQSLLEKALLWARRIADEDAHLTFPEHRALADVLASVETFSRGG